MLLHFEVMLNNHLHQSSSDNSIIEYCTADRCCECWEELHEYDNNDGNEHRAYLQLFDLRLQLLFSKLQVGSQ